MSVGERKKDRKKFQPIEGAGIARLYLRLKNLTQLEDIWKTTSIFYEEKKTNSIIQKWKTT
jgi:hypothetical protein